jgi:hypothetical protein
MNMIDAARAAGLDTPLPAAEQILWQGKPDGRALTRSIFHFRALGIYAIVAALIVFTLAVRARPLGQAMAETTLLLPFFLAAFGLLSLLGRASARATTYTLTSRRVILHIGVAFEMTISVPLSAIVNAGLRRRHDGSGEIALTVSDVGGVRYIALWPHARFGHFFTPQPTLRGLADPDAVAAAIGEALIAFNARGRRRTAAVIAAASARQAVAA